MWPGLFDPESATMKHTESEYINIGHRYERAPKRATGQAVAALIRTMLEAESIPERGEARRLIELGRHEARQRAHAHA